MKLPFLRACFIVNKIDVICPSETHFYSTASSDDDNVQVPFYYLIRAENLSNTEGDGVCF